jgi:hypothetical protein
MTDDQLRKLPAPGKAPGIEHKLAEAIAALSKVRELAAVDKRTLGTTLVREALSAANMSIQEILDQINLHTGDHQ